MKKVLIKDIVIPAGTVFTDVPDEVHYYGDYFGGCTIGLTKHSFGDFIYEINGDDKEIVKEWFIDLVE